MTDILVKFLVTGFYSGKIKYMPGTFGTLVGVLIFQLISLNSLLNNIFLLLVLFFLSLLLLNYSYKNSIFLNKDDKSIVIDEIFGYLIFMIFFENNLTNLLVGFMLFRFFDILKPLPISLIDKNIKNSFGVMFDDVIAALFSGVGLFLFNYVY